MTYAYYERLSAMDAVFLDIEDHNSHMHIGSVGIYDAGPLKCRGGGIDFDRILAHIEGALPKSPRFRQRLAYVPGLGRPVWIDDPSFNLIYHVRHACLPAPGDERQLKRLGGRIMSQQLDRGKPLWEIYVVEGLDDERFAVVTKLHHCLADGISGVDIATSLLSPQPDAKSPAPRPWHPRPAPSGSQLLSEELSRRIRAPLSLLGGVSLRRSLQDLRDTALGLTETLGSGGHGSASETPFDIALGPHRRFDWMRVDLAQVKLIKDRLGGKVNDVVLAVVAGALRRYFRGRGLSVADLNFLVMVPVSVRTEEQRGSLGNQVSGLLVRLPLEEGDPVKRLDAVVAETSQLKRGHQSSVPRVLSRVVDAVMPEITGPLVRLGLNAHAANMVVTNVPGPPVDVFMAGARLIAAYPVVPLAAGQALGIALLSNGDSLCWGFNSDWDALPDLHELVEMVDREFDALHSVAMARGEEAPRPKRKMAARKGPLTRKKAAVAGKRARGRGR